MITIGKLVLFCKMTSHLASAVYHREFGVGATISILTFKVQIFGETVTFKFVKLMKISGVFDFNFVDDLKTYHFV